MAQRRVEGEVEVEGGKEQEVGNHPIEDREDREIEGVEGMVDRFVQSCDDQLQSFAILMLFRIVHDIPCLL